MRGRALALILAAALCLPACSAAGEPPAGSPAAASGAPESADPLGEARERARRDMAGAVERALSALDGHPRGDLGGETEPFDHADAWEGYADLTEEQRAYLDTAADYIVENMPPEASAYDKYRYLACVLSLRADYDYEVREDNLSETPYGALAEGRAVCFGYVYTMQFLCERADLYCSAVEGVAAWNGEDHGWNLAMLPEGSYYMDITWCDQYGDIESRGWGEMFMVTEGRMAQDHGDWDGGPATGTVEYWP